MKKSALIVLSLVFLVACDSNPRPLVIEDVRLQRLESCDQLTDVLTVEPSEDVPNVAYDGSFGAPVSAEGDASGGGSSRGPLGETNLQVQGVDELDHAKADGDFIYTVEAQGYFAWGSGIGGWVGGGIAVDGAVMEMSTRGDAPMDQEEAVLTKVRVLRRSPANQAGVIQTVELPAQLWSAGLYLTENHVAVIGNTDDHTVVYLFTRESDGTISTEPAATREVDGSLQGSRMVGDRIHLVVSQWLETHSEGSDPTPVETMLPRTRFGSSDQGLVRECEEILIEPAMISEPYVVNNLICALSVDLADFEQDPAGECVVGNGWGTVVYASEANLFLADGSWDRDTPIHQFALADAEADTRYVGSAVVHGNLLNQFSMDEHEAHLRVATTTWNFAEASEQTNEVRVFSLGDGDPELTGEITGLAANEQIYAVRFLGDTGFVVTFLQVDPLFTLDLSDPANPVVRGELEVPGFSTYLHPMQEGYLVSIGTEEGEVALSIFDVRDLDHPAMLDRVTVGGTYGAGSEALYDHKAFRYIADEGLVIFPIGLYEETDYVSGFKIFSASVTDGLAEVGESPFPADSQWSYDASGRSFFKDDDDVISLLGGGELVLRSAADPATDLNRVSAE